MLVNRVNGKRYVGMSRNVRRRFVEHKAHRKNSSCRSIALAMCKYGVENFDLVILQECELTMLCERERFWIAKLKPEYNRNSGGMGNGGHALSDETRKQLSEHGKRQWANKTEQQRRGIISNNLTGPLPGHFVLSGTRQKISLKLRGRKWSPELRAKMEAIDRTFMRGNGHGNKAVVQVLNGLEGWIFCSVKAAAEECGIHPGGISACLKSRQTTAGGFSWKYFNERRN